ncbi:MAG TPA: tetratricopeptide repeat protein [Gemmatimonadales bacterium]|nr:tetratricopeptide repeat protein [Gemmatimonadales bacterium]
MKRIVVTILALGFAGTAASAQDSVPSLSTLEARVKAGDSLDALTEFRLALRYEGQRRYDDEERALRTAIAADPRMAPPYMLLSDMPYLKDKNLAKEERRHETPVDRLPALDSARRFRARWFAVNPFGELHLLEGNPLPQGTIVLPNTYSPRVFAYLSWVGEFAYFAERYDLSYGALDMLWSRRFPNAPVDSIPTWLLFYHGLAATQEGMYDKGANDFQVLVTRGTAQEQPDTMLRIPFTANAYRFVLAIIKERSNKPVDAIQLYHDIIQRDLGFYMAHDHLALLYRQYKMWDSATVEAQAAVEANPDDPSLLLDLGAIQRESGHLPDAAATLQRAVAIDPRYPEAYYRLGIVAQELHQSADAQAALTHFIAVAPRQLEPEVIDAKKRLDSLH